MAGNARPHESTADERARAERDTQPEQAPAADGAPTSRGTPSSLAPGKGGALYAGRFELQGLLGVGAMGSVYRARDRLVGETVALKVLRKDLTLAPLAVARFYREARLARRVTHPNVARVFDAAEHAGEHFMTMECVEGESLHVLLDRGRALGVRRAVAIAAQLARGLGAAHDEGIVHCDLKPENVIVEHGGRAVITDFGVSRVERDGAPPPPPGRAGGTPMYMAPEQLEGRPVDARTDLYALGLLVYEMLTGTTPWGRRGGLAGGVARLAVPPKDPREHDARVPAELAALVMSLLAREPEARPKSARDVEARLERVSRAVGVDRTSAPSYAGLEAPPPSARLPAAIATTANPSARGIAVLPLRNVGDDATRYVADALTTELSDRLALAPTLRVASRAAMQALENDARGDDLRALGRRLGVEAIVEGSVLARAGGDIRVSVRLIEVERGFVLWSARLDRPAKDLLKVADEAARDIARALGIELAAKGSAGPRGPSSDEAVDPFLRAKDAYGTFTADGARAAERILGEAYARAPNDPILASWLALAKLRRWIFEPGLGQGDEAAPVVARRIADAVLAKNPNVGEAHLARSVCAHLLGDERAALRSAREAIRCNPTLAEAHRMAGLVLSEASMTYEGERELDVSLRLDGRHVLAMLQLARTRALKKDYERATQWLDVAARRAPEHLAVFALRLQFAHWQGDEDAIARARPRVLELTRDGGGTYGYAARVLAGVHQDVEVGRLAAEASLAGTTSRRRGWIMKVMCEERARGSDLPGALAALRAADASGLIDVLWIERCPPLAPLRALSGFTAVRATVLERAQTVLRA